ncbi:hypothetical protein K4F52_003277 [Lecanicillium sp. MT-2017a]|nr:hypothetical protein K4F52_003277 [Lecanicillium sp. MT-2017a]
MSNYEKAPASNMTAVQSLEGHGHQASNSPQRPQLPSLSSLFGPPSSFRRPSSPLAGRSGSNPSQSPLDRPRMSGLDQSSSSYFPSPSLSQPRSTYEMKFDSDRYTSASMARSYSGSRSPAFSDMARSRSDNDNAWSMQQENSRHEYMVASHEASYRPHENQRSQHTESRDDPPEHAASRPVSATQSSAQATNGVVPEGTSSKDGLGPKIWTGTHFLPRFVRAAEVPGEGMCYFYDDGSHCKTIIDGEAVNAHWGVTKAGKPRKRLAIACITCREKKIKCDPDFPRCVQCDKFGRVCKFKNAPRGGHNTSPTTPPAELKAQKERPIATSEVRRSSSNSVSPMSHHTSIPYRSPDASYHKRAKVSPDSYATNGERGNSVDHRLVHSKSPLPSHRSDYDLPRIPEDVLKRASRTDPSVADPQSISSVITQFLIHADSSMMIRFLPESAWKLLIASSVAHKSAEDLMLLYSTLALGVAVSGGPKHIAYEYAQVAHYAQKVLGFNCLQLVQSRILLASYSVLSGRIHEATELLSSAAAVSTSLQLNLELEKSTESGMSAYPLGLNRASYSESRRRTFWSLFMLERLNGMYPNRPAMINPDDVYIRLPTDSLSFEKHIERYAPSFDPYNSTVTSAQNAVDATAFLVEMVHIWADSQMSLFRMACRPASAQSESGRIYQLAKKANNWYSALTARLVYSTANLEQAVYAGNAGSFISMHLLYHHAMIKVNRHHYSVSSLGPEAQDDYVRRCRSHAVSILDMSYALDRLARNKAFSFNTPPQMTAVAAVEAVDTLTASGPLKSLSEQIDLIRSARPAIDQLANVWEDAIAARTVIDRRLNQLIRIRERGSRATSPIDGYQVTGNDTCWQILEPIDRQLPKEMDVVYNAAAF